MAEDATASLFGGTANTQQMVVATTRQVEASENSQQVVRTATASEEDEVRQIWEALRKVGYCNSLKIPPGIFMSVLSGPAATIFVGPEPGKEYVLPMLLLYHRVEYFRNTFMGNFREASERILVLEDMEVEIFDTIMHWIFTDELQLPSDFMEDSEENHLPENNQPDVSVLIDVIGWADRFLFKKEDDLIKKAMERLEKHLHLNINRLTTQAVDAAFKSGSQDLKQLIAKDCVIPYLSLMEGSKVECPFLNNISTTPDFMRYISGELVVCLRKREILVNGRVVSGALRLRGPRDDNGVTKIMEYREVAHAWQE